MTHHATHGRKRCIVCGIADPGENTICPACKAMIRGEVLDSHKRMKKEAEKALHKTGTEVEKKPGT